MENPYASPEVQAEPLLDSEVPRFRVMAVVVGWISDIVFSTVMGLVIGIVAAVTLVMDGVSPERLGIEVANVAWIQWVSLIVGFSGTTIGGYVAAWMGRVWPLRHAVGVGIASAITGGAWVFFSTASDVQETWVSIVLPVAAVPAALLGGYLRMSRSRRPAEQ